MSKSRTTIAIPVSEEMTQHAKQAIGILRTSTDNIKWVSPENLHWTLQFLGDVDDTELHEVCQNVAQAAAEHESFDLAASGVGAFPSIESARTLWLGAAEGSKPLVQLQDHLEQSMADLGFHPDRRHFFPHLTLGRIGSGRDGGTKLAEQLAKMKNFDGGFTNIEEVHVFASELRREGPVYHVISRAPLMG